MAVILPGPPFFSFLLIFIFGACPAISVSGLSPTSTQPQPRASWVVFVGEEQAAPGLDPRREVSIRHQPHSFSRA